MRIEMIVLQGPAAKKLKLGLAFFTCRNELQIRPLVGSHVPKFKH
jgi:hypothetical protein